ncbi:MAG: NifB/NifX family molybdenum-iron cluster-binding protein [Nitrososphaeria archaeon]
MARLIVPIEGEKGLDSVVAEHFGRTLYFAIIDLDEKGEIINLKTISNVGEHFGGGRYTHDNILDLKPDAIIVYGMGPRGLSSFQSAGVAVFKANSDILKEVVVAYVRGELEELTEGCSKARHI